MEILRFDEGLAERIGRRPYDVKLASAIEVAEGDGEAHAYVIYFEPGGVIGPHEAGFGQILLALAGSGWVAGADDERIVLDEGEAAFINRGEVHSKGSAGGMTAFMVQVRDMTPLALPQPNEPAAAVETARMSQRSLPTLVVVSGPPGSGKTTLAHSLAQAIPCPAVCRDELKEGMAHAEGSDFQGGPGDPLTQRTLPVFFDVLATLVSAGVTVVAEAAFQDGRWRSGLEPLAELARLRIIRCTVDPAVSFERAIGRAAGNASHARAHGDSTAGKPAEDWARAFESFEHLSLPVPSLDVVTTDGYEPHLEQIVAFVNRS